MKGCRWCVNKLVTSAIPPVYTPLYIMSHICRGPCFHLVKCSTDLLQFILNICLAAVSNLNRLLVWDCSECAIVYYSTVILQKVVPPASPSDMCPLLLMRHHDYYVKKN